MLGCGGAPLIVSKLATSDPPHPVASHSGENRAWRLGFWSLIVTQFQNAFNDNAIKFLVIYLIVEMNFPKHVRDRFVWIVSALFAVPFVLFSLTGGYFADRYSKRSVVIGTKVMEIFVMLVTILGLWLNNLPLECAAVFLISTQSALFGPSKYGLLPEVLPDRELSWGNGIIELGTFIGSIGAVMAAGYLADHFRGRQYLSGLLLLGCTLFGLATSFGITHVPAADPGKKFRWNPLADLATQMKAVNADRLLNWAVFGNVYLWFLAALLQLTIVVYGHDTLHVNEAHISYLQAAVGIGIGVGSVVAGYASRGKIDIRLIPIGALGMTIFGALLYPSGHTVHSAAAHLAALGFFGGFFAVPLNALIQHRPEPAHRGGVIAAANLLSFIGVFFAAAAYYLFSTVFRQTPAGVFLDGAGLTGIMTVLCFYCYHQVRSQPVMKAED
jgi:acyl-[acyl-carrier-protein]-phospholipid O-acyltransferase/long-chain-fatty-acid--[acyl-carrier-protein] ligase